MRSKTTALSPLKIGDSKGSGLRAALLMALLSWSLGGSAASAQPTLTDLGTLPGDVMSIAYGINSSGTVVGISYSSAGSTRAFLWTPTTLNGTSGTLTDLSPYLSIYNNGAFGINDDDSIVGYFDAAVPVMEGEPGGFAGPGGVTYYKHAFLLTRLHARYDLNGAASTSTGVAYGINNALTESGTHGKVVGDKNGTAVLWPDPTSSSPPPAAVTLISPSIGSSARGINEDDVAVGWTDWPSSGTAPQSAFKWNATGGYTILSPNQQSSPIHFSEALGISSQGNHIVGWIEKSNESAIYAESWNGTTTGARIFPDALLSSTYWGGAIEGRANAVNNSDWIVGYCNTDPGTSPGAWHAFVSAGGSITDLNAYLTSGWQALVEAKAINDYTNGGLIGQIVGYGTTASGATHAFLLTP
jgi:probable HAF family extracellular repeat protein